MEADGGRKAPLEPGLHLLSTPIGAARDITLRGLDALREADILAAEDTRTLRRLMDIHGVPLGGRRLIAYHEHNAAEAGPKILAALAEGARVVYASDAGTPLIADPGWRIAKLAREAGVALRSLPGPSAALAALVVSGMPTDAFAFIGFLPAKRAARRRALEPWRSAPATLVIYENGRRLAAALEDAAATLGDRDAAVARELTKRFEEVRTGRLAALAAAYAAEEPPKGEIVLLIGRAGDQTPDQAAIDAALGEALAEMSARDAARHVSEVFVVGRKMVYERATELKRRMKDGASDGE